MPQLCELLRQPFPAGCGFSFPHRPGRCGHACAPAITSPSRWESFRQHPRPNHRTSTSTPSSSRGMSAGLGTTTAVMASNGCANGESGIQFLLSKGFSLLIHYQVYNMLWGEEAQRKGGEL